MHKYDHANIQELVAITDLGKESFMAIGSKRSVLLFVQKQFCPYY